MPTESHDAYYGISSVRERWLRIPRRWVRENCQALYCLKCAEALPRVIAFPPMSLDPTRMLRRCFEMTAVPRYGVVRDDLLDILMAEGGEQMSVGRTVDGKTGEPIPSFHYVRGRVGVLVRGNAESKENGICEVCGRHRYWPMPDGKGYLLRGSFPAGTAVLRTQVHPLCVNAAIHRRIVAAGLDAEMTFDVLPVRDEPEDGRPADMRLFEKP